MVLPSGELHIRDVAPEDGYKSYRCRTKHRLTGETRLSATAGRLVVTGESKKADFIPKLFSNFSKNNSVDLKELKKIIVKNFIVFKKKFPNFPNFKFYISIRENLKFISTHESYRTQIGKSCFKGWTATKNKD